MTNTPTALAPADTAPGADDPRHGFAVVTAIVGRAIDGVPAAALNNPTPCEDFTVKQLLEHIVMVMRRVAAVGRGEHWSTVQQDEFDGGFAEVYRNAAHQVMEAWEDSAKLALAFEVPWATLPGAPLIWTYTAELATHGWDLATATDQDYVIDDDALRGAWTAVQFIPAEGRDTPDIPFTDVVDPGPDAPLLLKIAGWMGRAVGSSGVVGSDHG